MAEIFNFIEKKLMNIKPPKTGLDTYRDEKEKGLILRVSYGGKKVFYFYKKVMKKPRMVRIGDFPDISIAEAREITLDLKNQVAKGLFPSINGNNRKSGGIVFKELFDKYIKDYAQYNLTKKGIKDMSEQIARHAQNLFGLNINEITKSNILELFNTISKTAKISANRTIAYLSAIFNKGIEWELIDKNPALGIKKHKEVSRDRYITLEEKEQFFEALEKEEDQQVKDFILIALYTGARKGNVLSMRWEDISFEQAVWYIKDTKNGDPQTAVLTEEAVKILERRKSASDSKWVFPSRTSKSGHFQEPRKGWERIIKRAGLKDLRIHDLRRTCGSWMALSGASQYVISKGLGHKSPQSTAIYARLSLDPVREFMEKSAKLTNGDLHKKIEELKKQNE